MIKVAYLMIVATFHGDSMIITELNALDSREQCVEYAKEEMANWAALGVPPEHMQYECVQVVVPAGPSK